MIFKLQSLLLLYTLEIFFALKQHHSKLQSRLRMIDCKCAARIWRKIVGYVA